MGLGVKLHAVIPGALLAVLGFCTLSVAPAHATSFGPIEVGIAAEQDDSDVPAYMLTLSSDKTSLYVLGGIRFGLARDIATALADNPGIKTIELDSPGGRIKEAAAVQQLISKRGLDTFASGDCLSACTLIFVGGRHRGLADSARLGFHGDDITDPIPAKSAIIWFLNQATVGLYTKAGVEQDFMQHVISIPPESMWFPTHNELLAAHVLIGDADGQTAVLPLPLPVRPLESVHGGSPQRSLAAVH